LEDDVISIVKKKLLVLLLLGVSAFQLGHAETQPIGTSVANEGAQSSAPVNVIFDTDMWSDIDDMLALAMLHTLQDRHEVNLLAVTITTDDPWSASYVDLVDTFYVHSEIPVGVVRGGITAEASIKKVENGSPTPILQRIAYVQALSERRNPDGSRVYPHRLVDGAKALEAVALLRKTLAAQPDGSVVIIQVGFSTNLARLMDSPPDATSLLAGSELVKKKVRLLSVMAGNFGEATYGGKSIPKGQPEFNLWMDIPSAQKLFERWPTPIVVSGFEIGLKMLFPAKSIEEDFTYVQNHPIAESYRYYTNGDTKWPHDHATFDLTSVLYAARPDRGYFSLSKPGKITVLSNGGAKFEEIEGGLHRYLILEDNQRARTLEAMVMLASQPPAQNSRH
jgi:inosine-uridine nucleoside N-ribohydrolase